MGSEHEVIQQEPPEQMPIFGFIQYIITAWQDSIWLHEFSFVRYLVISKLLFKKSWRTQKLKGGGHRRGVEY